VEVVLYVFRLRKDKDNGDAKLPGHQCAECAKVNSSSQDKVAVNTPLAVKRVLEPVKELRRSRV
jgi:hypothetical protein